MPRLATISRTGHHAYDQVFKGVYGTVAPSDKEGRVIFQPAPEFGGISHVFSHMPRIEAPADGVHEREVGDEDVALAKAQILFGLGARWNSLYSSRVGDGLVDGVARDIGTAALAGEMKSVADNVRRALSNSGLQVFEVPVIVKGRVERFGGDVGNLDVMIAAMTERSFEVDPDQAARPLGTLGLSGAKNEISAASEQHAAAAVTTTEQAATPHRRIGSGMDGFRNWLNSFMPGGGGERTQEPAAAAPEAPAHAPCGEAVGAAQPPVNAAWASFRGINAQVRAIMYVVAPDARHAARAVPLMVQAYEQDAAGLHLEPKAIGQVQDLQLDHLYQSFESDPDFEDSGFDRPRY